MFGNVNKTKLKLEKKIILLSESNPVNKNLFINTYIKYLALCKKYNLEDELIFFDSLENVLCIDDAKPYIFEVDEESVANVVSHVMEVCEKNKEGLVDGISLKECELLLNWVVQNGWSHLERDLNRRNSSIEKHNLSGLCGGSQSITLMPLSLLGLEVTINNVNCFEHLDKAHAFGSVMIPIKEDNKCFYKHFLIDITYSQFFSLIRCVKDIAMFKENVDVGYFVCLSESGKKFAKTLLNKGFIELTSENAYYYGFGFTCNQLHNSDFSNIDEIAKKSGEEYISEIIKNQQGFEHDLEELIDYEYNIFPPGYKHKTL